MPTTVRERRTTPPRRVRFVHRRRWWRTPVVVAKRTFAWARFIRLRRRAILGILLSFLSLGLGLGLGVDGGRELETPPAQAGEIDPGGGGGLRQEARRRHAGDRVHLEDVVPPALVEHHVDAGVDLAAEDAVGKERGLLDA